MPEHTIHGLHGGISQQSPALRLPSQTEDQTNVRNTVVRGIMKRPGTVHKAVVTPPVSQSTSTNVEPMSHAINRDASERYMVLFFDDATEPIVVLDEDGTKQTVNYGAAADKTYVRHQAKGDIKVATLDDTTVIVNTGETTALVSAGNTIQPYQNPKALLWFKPGYNNLHHTYNFEVVDGMPWPTNSFDAYTGNVNTHQAAKDFVTNFNATGNAAINGYITATQLSAKGSVVLLNSPFYHFRLTTGDSYGNGAVSIIKDEVDKVSDLPPEAPDGFTVTVRGEEDVHFKFDAYSSKWVETMAPGVKTTIDGATMPRKMVRTSLGVFDVSEISYDLRTVGDDTTTPIPTFIDNTISDVTFYKDRLVFLSGQSVIASRTNDHFNFWPQSAAEALDDDPIDVTAAHSSVAFLTGLLPFEDSLLVFSERQVFVLHSGDSVFSPNHIVMDQAASADFNSNAQPVLVGSNAYFVGEQNNASTVWEYFVDSGSVTQDVVAVTSHVPDLVPKDLQLIAASSLHDTVLFYSPTEATTLYVYQFFWQGPEKAMSAWTKWTLSGPLQGMEFLGDTLYLALWETESGGSYTKLRVETLDLNPTAYSGDFYFQVAGDTQIDGDDISSGDVTYNSGPDTTEIDLGVDVGTGTWYGIWKVLSGVIAWKTSTSASGTTVTFPGDLRQLGDPFEPNWTKMWFVRSNTHSTTLTPWLPRDQNGRGAAQRTLRAKGLSVSVYESGSYTVTVTPDGRSAQTNTVTRTDSASLVSDARRHSVMCDPQTSVTTISDNGPMPLNVDVITWDGPVTKRRLNP